MSERYYVGVDLHKRTFHYSILSEAGEMIHSRNVRCDDSGLADFNSHLTPLHHLVVEPVANVHWFLDKVGRYAGSYRMAHPLKVRLIAQSRTKSDSYDSRILADLLRVGYLPEAYIAEPNIQDLRSLVSHRHQLVADKTRTKNRITFQFTCNGIVFNSTDPFGKRGRQKMEDADLPPIARFRVDELLETLDRLEEKINRLEEKLSEMMIGDPIIPLLESIPGVGFVTAVTIRAITGDIDRFKSVKAYSAFTGLIPASRQSGEHSPKAGITYQGSKVLRSALVQSAPIFMRRDQRAKQLHTRLFHSSGSRKKARIAVAHRLAKIVYHVWKDRRQYIAEVEEVRSN